MSLGRRPIDSRIAGWKDLYDAKEGDGFPHNVDNLKKEKRSKKERNFATTVGALTQDYWLFKSNSSILLVCCFIFTEIIKYKYRNFWQYKTDGYNKKI